MKFWKICGIAGPLIAFFGIAVAVWINRDWWSITDNAISDLGRLGLEYNYVLNLSLIISGLITLYSSFYVVRNLKDYISMSGMILFVLSLIGLTLIGIFPEGTSLHGVVSYIFFYGGTFAMLIGGIGLSIQKIRVGWIIVSIIIVEIVLAEISLGIFRGVAIPELIAALGIVSSYYLILISVPLNEKS